MSESPGSGDVNLALARIAARKRLTSEVLRYYHGAIYGEWENDPIAMRWQVRRELAEYLLDGGLQQQAVPEIIALADSTPADNVERAQGCWEFPAESEAVDSSAGGFSLAGIRE